MKLTEHLKLKKPDQTDFYNVEDFNENMEIMDLAIHEHGAEKNNPHEVTKEQVGLSNVQNVATNDQAPTYGIASVRENLSSGEKLSTAFGKIRRWFADLKAVAFSGSYQDLTNKPTSLPANGGNADTVDGFHGSDLFIKNKLNNSTKGLTLDDNADTWVPFKSYRTTSEGKFSAALAVSYNGGGVIEVRDETDGTAGTITSRLELQQNGDIKASTGRIIADGGNADTVDGYHAKNLMVYETNSFNGDIDTISSTCTLFMQGATCKTIPKSPDKNESVYYGYLIHIRGLNNDWQCQLMKTLSGTLYFRQKKYNNWETAWTTANDNGNAKMVNGIKIYSNIKEIGSYSTISNVCKNMPLSSILVSYAFRNEYTDLPQSGSYWNLHIHKDFQGHCAINAVHFSGGKPGNNCYSHTDATAGWEIVWKTNSIEGHTHNNIQGKGKLPAATSSVHGEGLSMGYVYNNGYPVPYGNVLRMGGEGDGELLIGWSGTTGEKAPAYIRSCRDSSSMWSDWDKIITESCLANNLTTIYAGYALDARQGNLLNTRLGVLENERKNMQYYASGAYSVYYPEKDYTMNGVGVGTGQYFGYLNLYNSVNPNMELYSVTKTAATSDNCRGNLQDPTNYIKVNRSGLYQIDVKVTKKGTYGFKATVKLRNGENYNEVVKFGSSDDRVHGSINMIQYIEKGTDLYVLLEANVSTGNLSINRTADPSDGVMSGIFIKRIM